MKVYIDGENLRHVLVNVFMEEGLIEHSDQITSFPVRKLLNDILDESKLDIYYYASKIKLPRGHKPSKEILSHADEIRQFTRRWVPRLAEQDIQYVKAGYLKVKDSRKCPKCGHIHEALQEKGVDVRIAVDIISDAYNKHPAQMALVSSDTDLIPALDKIKDREVKITYICFGESVNRAIAAVADETVTFSRRKLTQLFQQGRTS